VSGDTNAVGDIFLYDRTAGTTTRISTDATGGQANGLSQQTAISADGTRVAFESEATNLVAGDTNAKRDIFVKVLATGAVIRASVSTAGVRSKSKRSRARDDGEGGSEAVRDAMKSCGRILGIEITKEMQRHIHDLIHGLGYGYCEIL
jgi:hypothetical protein